jgi:hypothetical protein
VNLWCVRGAVNDSGTNLGPFVRMARIPAHKCVDLTEMVSLNTIVSILKMSHSF